MFRARGNYKYLSAVECAEIAAEAGLVGADLDAGTAGAVEAGGLKTDVDMHGGMGGAQLFGELERASGTVGTLSKGLTCCSGLQIRHFFFEIDEWLRIIHLIEFE